MAKRASLTDVSSGYQSNSVMNDNFEALNENFDNTLSRDGSSPNQMEADIDMNSNDVLNAGTVHTDVLKVNGRTLTDASAVPNWEGAWVTATPYVVDDLVQESGNTYICVVAHTSGVFATDLSNAYWELFASKGSSGGGTGDLLAANNLSDVNDAAASIANIGGIPAAGGTATGLVTFSSASVKDQVAIARTPYATHYLSIDSDGRFKLWDGADIIADFNDNDDDLQTDVSVVTRRKGDVRYPNIESGAGAPASTPGKIGDLYVDTSAPALYYADGTSSSADWNNTANPAGQLVAMANFDGTAGVTINRSSGVSTIVRDSTGVYTVTLSSAMADANYVVTVQVGTASVCFAEVRNLTTTSFQIYVYTRGSSVADANPCMFTVHY